MDILGVRAGGVKRATGSKPHGLRAPGIFAALVPGGWFWQDAPAARTLAGAANWQTHPPSPRLRWIGASFEITIL